MTRPFSGFAEAILRCRRHLNPNHSNYIDLTHVRLRVSHVHYNSAEDPLDSDECIDDSGTLSPPPPHRHIECDYRLGNKNRVDPFTTHSAPIPNGTTNLLFRMKYY
jgi:hypothetical protein